MGSVYPPAQGSTTYPPGVYTRVQWNIGTMAPGAVVTRPYAAGIPLRRLGTPEELAHTARFIFENDYITGRVIETDGGIRL